MGGEGGVGGEGVTMGGGSGFTVVGGWGDPAEAPEQYFLPPSLSDAAVN